MAQHGGLQNLYSPVRIRSSPPHSEHEAGPRAGFDLARQSCAPPGNVRCGSRKRRVPRAKRVVLPAILATGIGGILLGTVFGPITSFGALFGTIFGWTFLAAVVFGLVAFYPKKPAWLIRLRAEPIAFFGAFTCMILMHFGM